MTQSPKDALLPVGKIVARLLQGVCALAGGALLLLIPIVVLLSHNILPGFSGANDSETIKASPLTVVAICATLALILAALFLFFGKLRAIIVSAGEGDPFTPENASHLNAMAWLFLGVKILAMLVVGLRLHLANLMDTDANGGNPLGFGLYDIDAIVIVIVLFILARIFRHGAAMREDLKGTV
jgi:preprotein translocase subunit Sec61beta